MFNQLNQACFKELGLRLLTFLLIDTPGD